MALSSAIQWEVRTTGSDNNGGGFKYGASGTDYSQQDTAQKSGSDLAIHASDTTKVQPGAGVAAADVGNVIQITAGTGFTTGFYEITAQDGTYWTLDRSAGTAGATGGTYAMGGALATPGKVGAAHVAYNTIHIQAGTYNVTVASANVSNGALELKANTVVEGYTSTRWDRGGRPVITAVGISSYALLRLAGSSVMVVHLTFDCNSCTGVNAVFLASGQAAIDDCHAIHCKATAFRAEGAARLSRCYVQGVSGATAGGIESAVYAFDCVVEGMYYGYNICYVLVNCIADGCASSGFRSSSAVTACINCTAYNCGGDGYDANGYSIRLTNCIASNNTGYGVRGGGVYARMINCATYNNTAGATYSVKEEIGTVTLTGSPFTDAANDDFSLNNTSGAGAACRNAGYGTMPGDSYFATTGYPDIGAVQHQDAGGSGGAALVAQLQRALGVEVL